jgi:hypothetical protein
VGKDQPQPWVGGYGVAEEAAALSRQRLRSAGQHHAQARLAAQLPEDADAGLHALAVVARQLHQRVAVTAQEVLQLAVDVGLTQWPAGAVGKAELGELTGLPAGLADLVFQQPPRRPHPCGPGNR